MARTWPSRPPRGEIPSMSGPWNIWPFGYRRGRWPWNKRQLMKRDLNSGEIHGRARITNTTSRGERGEEPKRNKRRTNDGGVSLLIPAECCSFRFVNQQLIQAAGIPQASRHPAKLTLTLNDFLPGFFFLLRLNPIAMLVDAEPVNKRTPRFPPH